MSRGTGQLRLEHLVVGEIPVLYVRTPDGPAKRPVVIHFHGLEATKETDLLYAWTLAKGGYGVALCENPYHGERAPIQRKGPLDVLRTCFESALVETLLLHDHFAARPDCTRDLLLSGRSLGGFRALLAAADLVKEGKKPKALVALGAGGDFRTLLVRSQSPFLKDPILRQVLGSQVGETLIRHFDPLSRVKDLAYLPIFLGAGADDKTVPVEATKALAEALGKAGGPHEMEIVPGLGHGLDARLESWALVFLRKYCAPGD